MHRHLGTSSVGQDFSLGCGLVSLHRVVSVSVLDARWSYGGNVSPVVCRSSGT